MPSAWLTWWPSAKSSSPERLLDAVAVAERLGVTRAAVYELVKRSELEAIYIGTGDRPRLRFNATEIDAYLAGGRR